MSKVILSKVVESIIATTGLNLWKSTREVLQWFQETLNKQASSFINFDIDFYPSITEHLLLRAIDFAKQYAEIKESDIDIIINAKRTLVFYSKEPWIYRYTAKQRGAGNDTKDCSTINEKEEVSYNHTGRCVERTVQCSEIGVS